MDGHGLPVDLLRLVLQAVLGEERQDAYRLVRDLQRFALVCKTWREAVFSTPLRLNLDYQPEVKWEAVRWLLRATFADLQIHPNFHINRLLTNPDFAARNKWSLQRLWGAQLAGAPGRWPQWRHFPALHTLELSCDSQAMAMGQPQFFESRLLAPLPKLKHLSLMQFGGADLSRLPRTLRTLHADLDAVLPLALPLGLRLEELSITTGHLLVDWGQLCSQVERLVVIEATYMDLLAPPGGGPAADGDPAAAPPSLCRHAADGFMRGRVLEMELVGQEVNLVRVGGGAPPRAAIPEEVYDPQVLESMHLVSMAADFQTHDYRHFGCIYNPDDLQAEEELGMTDGMTVRLHRHLPDQAQVVGFSYGLGEEQASYLLSEARVEGLALEAVEAAELSAVLNSGEFQARCGGSLRWLQGLDLLGELQLEAFPQLQRVEGYVLMDPSSAQAVSRLPAGLTSLDLCGVPREEDDPFARDSWPDFVNRPGQQGGPSIAHLRQLQELSLRHFREVDLSQHVPPSVEVITLECPRPLPTVLSPDVGEPPLACTCPACMAALPDAALAAGRHGERFSFLLPPLEPGAHRTLNIQLHQNEDYALRRPILFLSQFLAHATHVAVSVTTDPQGTHALGPPEEQEEAGEEEEGGGAAALPGLGEGEEGEEGEEEEEEGPLAAHLAQPVAALQGPTLVLAAGHGTLREALDALTASRLESIDVEAAEVLFTDGLGASYTGSRRMQQFIREHYGHTWLVWSHDAVHPDEEVAEEDKGWGGHARQGGGFTLRRKYPDAPSKPRHASPTGARMYNR